MAVMTSLLLLASLSTLCSAEVFSSASNMREVFRVERDLVQLLEGYSRKLEERLERINGYMQEFYRIAAERPNGVTEDDFFDSVVGNPIHAYKMMKRFSVDLSRIEKDMKDDDWANTEFEIRRKRLGSVMPKDDDLHGAAQAIIRLQDVYELDIRDLSKGDIGLGRFRTITNAGLSAQDCLFLGKHCFNSGALSRSLEWFEEAWVIAGAEGNRTVRQDQVQQFLDHAAKTHDQKVMQGEKGPNLFPKPVYEEPPFEQREKLHQEQRDKLRENITDTSVDKSFDDDIPRFNALCRGEEFRPASYVAKLKCYLTNRGDPFYSLQPVKEETMHLDPKITLFHEVMSDKEMKIVKDLAGPLLMRSQVQGEKAGNSEVSMTRTSKTGWLQDSFDPVIQKLANRIGWITGLATNTWNDEAELLQVANYLNGGHYNPHHDYVMKDREPDHMIMLPHKGLYLGDRIATWMFYMSEVPAGGRTVFPRVGAGVNPERGSAVFWHNLLPSGEPDRNTLHGACPILYGTKWVSNKWIREGAQVFTRPCQLQRDAK